ncbi:unnamed protein product [Darwinula stevensoni]|uniref:Uncharacterized protein n=1 Tax=Darwinula stevensoni TaxID=69355 RepID=A0A7R8XEQ5_9CRUS|nr:unnamed protein product [Darwinula stevensoni]CAG0888059.1 unnamed protein product [Darwinula stevensoni]
MRWPGEVPTVDKETSKNVLKVLRENGVVWDEKSPPVILDTRPPGNISTGFLESLSVSLTGSLLHLPLLKQYGKL